MPSFSRYLKLFIPLIFFNIVLSPCHSLANTFIGCNHISQASSTAVFQVGSSDSMSSNNVADETAPDKVAEIVQNISKNANKWKGLPLNQKIDFLEKIIKSTKEHEEEWVVVQEKARGVDFSHNENHGYGYLDILVSGPATFGSYANGILTSLKTISKKGAPPPPVALRNTTNGKTIATVWPDNILDSLEAFGMKGELVLPSTSSSSSVQQTLEEVTVGGVAAILAAGNFDAPVDLLTQLFLRGRVCIYKPNPVNKASIAVLEKILEPLVSAGYVAFVKGGPTVGEVLVKNDSLDEIVLTGSANTLNKIQWGSTPEEQDKNRQKNTPIINTPVCSELGAVNSWIIVPGPQWNMKSVNKHARALAFAKLANNGHICVSPQVLVVPKDWKFRQAFMDRLRFWLGEHPGSAPFYPGSPASHEFFQKYPKAELISQEEKSNKPLVDTYPNQQRPILIPDASIENDKVLLQREAWCPVLVELPIDFDQNTSSSSTKVEDPMDYLKKAVQTVETNCEGSLSIGILINDSTVKKQKEKFDEIIADIPFGIVGINIWPIFANSMAQLRWGAFPGYPASGSGSLGNCRLYRNAEKTVLRAPFSYLPRKSVEVVSPRKAALVFSRMTKYKLKPNLLTQAALFSAVLLGF